MQLTDVKKIIIVNLGGIGDVLLSLPAVRALRKRYQNVCVDILVTDRAGEVAAGSGMFDNIFLYTKRHLENIGLILKLRSNRYDLAINMRTIVNPISALKILSLFAVINAKISAGRNTDNRGFFFNIKLPEHLLGDKYEMEYDIEMAQLLDAEVPDRKIVLDIDQDAIDKVSRVLKRYGISPGSSIICINPGGMPSRRWPIGRMKEAIEKILRTRPCSFVITGSTAEHRYADDLTDVKDINVVNLAGKLNFKELCALIKISNVFISNDTGPMHIAAVLETPLVAILGPGDLRRFDPRTISSKAIVLYKPVKCAPCNKFSCLSMRCLKGISPQEVANAAIQLLERWR